MARARRHLARAAALGAGLLLAGPAPAGESLLVLDPERTELRFHLGATLHTVRGSFALSEGRIRFDLESGSISGRVVVDAGSGETGLASRDRNMHDWVLKSDEHPRIVFTPRSLGALSRSGDAFEVRVAGRVEIAGGSHPLEIPLRVRFGPDGEATLEGAFEVPYVGWGLTDPSTFVLRVDKHVAFELSARGRLDPASGPPPAAAQAAPAAPPPGR